MNWALPEVDTYFAKVMGPKGFEIDHLEYALKYCIAFNSAVDGGAHVGSWTLYLANMFKLVYAFEPAPDTYECLKRNTAGRHFGKVIALRGALSLTSGHCIVSDDPTRVGNTGSRTIKSAPKYNYAQPAGANYEYPHGLAQMYTLDSFSFKELDFLKLDVEGEEINALKGAVMTINRCAPTIVVECKEFNPPRHGGPVVVRKFLSELNYIEIGGIRNDRVFVPKFRQGFIRT